MLQKEVYVIVNTEQTHQFKGQKKLKETFCSRKHYVEGNILLSETFCGRKPSVGKHFVGNRFVAGNVL